MQGNPWQLIGDDQMETLSRLGKFGLENGLIDPKQAVQSALNMGNMSANLFDVNNVPNPGQAAPNRVGSKIGFERSAKLNRTRTRKILSNRDPDDIIRAEKGAQGITPGEATDELGNPIYQEEPLLDLKGNPILRPDGSPAMGPSDRPVLDPSKDIVDPEHPIQQQKQGLERLKDMLRAQIANSPVQLDLSPIARLIDNQYGTDTAKGYQARRPDFDKALNAEDEIQKRQADISKQIKEYAQNTLKGGSTTDALNYLLADKISNLQDNTPKGGSGATTPESKYLASWQAYSKPNREALEASQNALATLTSGSKVGLEAFKNFMARASGEKGPLSEDDVKRFQGSQAARDRIDRAWAKFNSGTMTERDQDDMRALANAYVDFRRGLLNYDHSYYSTQVGPTVFKIDPGKASTIIKPATGFGLPDKPKGPPEKSLEDKVLEKLKARKAAPKAAPSPAPAPSGPKKFEDRLKNAIKKKGLPNGQ